MTLDLDSFPSSDQILVSASDNSQLEEMCHLGDWHTSELSHRGTTCKCSDRMLRSSTGLSLKSLIWSNCYQCCRLESHCLRSHRRSTMSVNGPDYGALCQKDHATPEPELKKRFRFGKRRQCPSLRCHRLPLLTIALLALCTFPGIASTPNRDAWRHHSVSSPPKAKSHRNFAASGPASRQTSYLRNYQANSAAIATHRRTAPSANLPNYNPYLANSHLLSVPFSKDQHLLYQHQMLPHHSTFPIVHQPTVSTGQALSHQMPNTSGGRNKLNLDPNHAHMLATNSIRGKGSKWWDTRGQSSLTLDQVTHMDGRHANSILQTNSLSNLPMRKKQRRLAKENPGLLMAVTKAMKIAISECQNQLKDHRWNCPVKNFKIGRKAFGKIMQTACRETAFVYALTSAAVAHSIARACSEGMIDTCTCDNTPTKQQKSDTDWVWGGCSDNIKFGYKYARSFLDAYEKGRDQKFVMNLHNNEAGRLHVSNQMRRECKCHGMSGSCTVKTCWMRLATFREIGDNLKERFDKASRVRVSNDLRGISKNKYKYKKSVQLETYEKGYPSPTSTDLIFFEESPDFCIANPKFDLHGTSGRECNASSISVDSCNLVCCDRGYTTEEIEVTERCNCTFRWCCEVNCSICKVKKKIHRCK